MVNVPEKTDAELLQQYQLDKNPSSLNILFSRYLDVGFRTAMRYMRNQSDAEDVLQVAFIQFLSNLHNFREDATSIKPWLMKMIVNTSINKLKEERRRSKRQQSVASERFMENNQQENKSESTSDDELLKQKIKKLVEDLPEKYRSPICLVLYEGFSYPEVASVLSIPEKTVRNYVYRGIEKLKGVLGSYGSVLSVDAISVLMMNSTLSKAPATTQHIIHSPQLHQAIQSAAHSNRFLAVKPSLFSVKIITIFALSCVFSFSGYYLFFNKTKENASSIPQVNPTSPKYTNQTWSFEKESDRKLALLMGNWEWSTKNRIMVPGNNSILAISLPIKSQDKVFEIDASILPIPTTKENPKRSYIFRGFWVKDNKLLEIEQFDSAKRITETVAIKSNDHKVYFYQNYICVFLQGKCIHISKCTQDFFNANVAILSKDYVFFKIASRTLDAPPDELLKAIDKIPSLEKTVQQEWIIDASKVTIDSENTPIKIENTLK